MIVAGIDLSLTATGIAGVDLTNTVVAGSWDVRTVSSAHTGNGERAYAQRIRGLVDEITATVSTADVVVLESPALSRNTGRSHERAGLWWILYSYLELDIGMRIVTVRPNLRAKYATGKGNAGKDTVMLAAARRYPEVPIRNNNEADAVILAAMGARLYDAPVDSVPKTHRSALDTVTVPPAPYAER